VELLTLGGMAKGHTHKAQAIIHDEPPHFLRAHLESRAGWNQRKLAGAIGTSEVNVSRWLKPPGHPDYRKLPDQWRRKIERLWALPRNAILSPPGAPDAEPKEAFLAGLSKESQDRVIEYRDLQRAKESGAVKGPGKR